MKSYDVVIVGAGPAGSATALALMNDQGLAPNQILVVDRAKFPRQKLCGGGLTARGDAILRQWGVRLPAPYLLDGLVFRTEFGQVLLKERGQTAVYDRLVMDDALLATVRRCGVEVRTGTLIEEIEVIEDGHRRLQLSGGDIVVTQYVIAADGVSSQMRRHAGLKRGWLGRLLEFSALNKDDAMISQNCVEFDFEPVHKGIEGYLWAFPFHDQGEVKVKYGIMDRQQTVPRSTLRECLAEYTAKRGVSLPEKVEGYPERYFRPFERASSVDGRVLCVGDAWGIDPLLGEGLSVSFEMAKYAAKRIASALKAGGRPVRGYAARWCFTVAGVNLWINYTLSGRMYRSWSARQWRRLLVRSEALATLCQQQKVRYGQLWQQKGALALVWFRQQVRIK